MSREEVFIRDVVSTDLAFIYKWENNPENWAVSETKQAYTMSEIEALVASSSDFFETRQKRWMICRKDNMPIGAVDIFQGDFKEGEVGIGILIADENDRRKGYAEHAINLAVAKSINNLSQDTIIADVHSDNQASRALFIKCGFHLASVIDDNSNFDSISSSTVRFKLCAKK